MKSQAFLLLSIISLNSLAQNRAVSPDLTDVARRVAVNRDLTVLQDPSGNIGFWVGNGSDGDFSNLKVTRK